MAKSSSTNTSSANTSFTPSMNFGAPTPGEVANNAGLGPFGTVNWSSGPSSTIPAKDNAAEVEVNKPTTPTVDVSGVNAEVNNEAVTSEVALANNPSINAVEDFSWVTDSKWNPEYEVNHWDNKAEQAREVAGYNQRKARNWTYAGDWRATDKPVYTMSDNSLIPNYKNERKYDKFVAPLEMAKAWDESKAMIASENRKAEIREAIRNAGKEATNVNPEAAKEFQIGDKAIVYPNDMSKAEFDAMYEYALGMTGRGGDQEVDDYGEPIGMWGGMETLPTQISSLTQQIADIDARLNSGKVKGAAKKALEADRAELLGKVHEAEAYLESMSTFIDNYASMYNPESKDDEESKESKALKEAEAKYSEANNALAKAKEEFNTFAKEKGIDADENVDIRDTPYYEGLRELTALDAAGESLGKGKTTNIVDSTTGVTTKVTHNEDDSWTVVTSNGTKFTGKGDGTDNMGSGLGLVTGDTALSPDTVYGSAELAAWGSKAAKNYFGDAFADSKGYPDYRSAVIKAEKAAKDAKEAYDVAMNAKLAATHEDAKAKQQDIMDAYAAGKINAYQAAVALSHIKDSEVNMPMDDITAAIDKDSFKGLGKVDDETIGIDSFKDETVGEDFAKIATEEFTSLNEIAEEINSIDVSKIENIEQAREAKAKLDTSFANMAVEANNHLEQLVSDLMAEGKSLKEARDSKAFKSMATEIFAMAQAIYDKTCAIEEYTNRYFGDIDISSKRSIKKNIDVLSKRIDVMTNKVSPTMTKEDINALAKYSKSIESTKDAAIALMKASAFNGAKNVKGDFYSEAWKSANAEDFSVNIGKSARDFFAAFTPMKDSGKLTIGDFAALGLKGVLGFGVTGIGIAMIAVNPVIGTLLAFAGLKSATENTGKAISLWNRNDLTNEETMFDENLPGYSKVWNSVYNRSFEKANIGDPKSVATYTTIFGLLADFAKLTTGVGALMPDVISSIRDKIDNLANGGMKGRTDALITNVYNLGKNIIEWADANPGAIEGLAREGNKNEIGNTNPSSTSYTYLNAEEDKNEKGKKPLAVEDKGRETSFGVEGGSAEAAASTFSGAREQAKNSNLATDYNAGMEQEVNEAVSDERVKGYIVKIYGSEPDFIRNAISKILTAHSEREWK